MDRRIGKILGGLVFCFFAVTRFCNGKEITWLERIKNQKVPYIANYGWQGGLNQQLSQELFQEYLRMGFTGIYKTDYDSGVRLFLKHGLHGFMWQTYWSYPDPVLKKDGTPAFQGTIYGCLSSERNIDAGAREILQFIRDHREKLYMVDGYYIFSSWDETGIQPSLTYCQCPQCQKLFRNYLQDEVYKDVSPANDSNQDGKRFNEDAGTNYTVWGDIPLPQFGNRFEKPILWKYFMDFTGWKTARFFARVEEEVNKAGEPMAYMLFYHSSMYWPGMGPQWGITPYYQVSHSPIIVNEFCIADWPISTIVSAWNDRLSREYGKAVYDFSWFWPGHQEPGDFRAHKKGEYERALARKMGHTLHGLIFWFYEFPFYNHVPEIYQEIAYWHHFLQKHWDFLKEAEPIHPEIAVLYPGFASYYYCEGRYPKTDFGWGPQALLEGQYPFTVIQEEEVESGILKDYKALYVFSVERTSKKVLEEIGKFIKNGGYVFADADSLLMTINGTRSSLLEEHFGVSLKKKYKSTFWPTVLSAGEDVWAKTIENSKKGIREIPSPPVMTLNSLQQQGLDSEEIHTISLSQGIIPSGQIRTYHDIVTGTAVGGNIIGTFRGEPVAIETAQTTWFGNRPGFDVYAIFPEDILAEWGEPIYPYRRNPTTKSFQRNDYRRIITYLAEKAGIRQPVVVTYKGDLASHVEVAVKKHPITGGEMIFLINHDDIGGVHEVEKKDIPHGFVAWDVTADHLIETNTDGRFSLDLVPLRARVLFLGPDNQVRQISRNQRELLDLDLSPIKFSVGPKTLSEPPLLEIEPVQEPDVSILGEGEVARLRVVVTNMDKKDNRASEPVIIPAKAIVFRLMGASVRGVRLASGEPVQWDDLDKDGVFSAGDEIVWQTSLLPNEKRVFVLSLLEQPDEVPKKEDFSMSVSEEEANIYLTGEKIFVVGRDNSWQFPKAMAKMDAQTWKRFGRHPGARFFIDGELEKPQIQILADGPVRKLIKVTHGYQPFPSGYGSEQPAERVVQTSALYAVYGRQVTRETRVYVQIEHKIEKDFVEHKHSLVYPYDFKGGRLVGLSVEGKGWYKDTLGRVGPIGVDSGEVIEKNFGGWLAIQHGENTILGILARRTRGVVVPRPVPDEEDGIQVFSKHAQDRGAWLTRSFVNWNVDNIRNFVDREIMAGNRFRLECLLVLKEGDSWQYIDRLRNEYTMPCLVRVKEWTIAKKRK